MIRNLNQLSFRNFGNILPERGLDRDWKAYCRNRQTLNLTRRAAPVYQSSEKCWLDCVMGMTVLAVSLDRQQYQYFYLDKPVCIKEQVYFSLEPLQKESQAELVNEGKINVVGFRDVDSKLLVNRQMQVNQIYTFFYQEKEQGFVFPGEIHPFPELTYVDRGKLHSVADGQDVVLEQGDIMLYRSNQWHMQYADIGIAPRYVTISFEAAGSTFDEIANHRFQAPQQVLTLLQQMLYEQEHMDVYSNDMIISLLNQLLLILLRKARQPAESKIQTANSVRSENEIISRAQQYISSHIRTKLSVPVVARMVDVSPSYLTALFHKHLQIAPGEYIRRIKLQESKQMIREDNMNFTEIAAALQYSTVHHFSRQFKEKFGITPTEYAKSVR